MAAKVSEMLAAVSLKKKDAASSALGCTGPKSCR